MPEKKSDKRKVSKFIQFSGAGIQLGVTIYLGSVLGEWLDANHPKENVSWTSVVTLIAVFVAMTSLIIQVIRFSKDEE